jgi:hypothetical protein
MVAHTAVLFGDCSAFYVITSLCPNSGSSHLTSIKRGLRRRNHDCKRILGKQEGGDSLVL